MESYLKLLEEYEILNNKYIELENIYNQKLNENLENELNKQIEKNEDKINQLKKINDDLLIYYEENILKNNIESIDKYNNIKNTCGQTNSLLSVIKNNIEFVRGYCKCEEFKEE